MDKFNNLEERFQNLVDKLNRLRELNEIIGILGIRIEDEDGKPTFMVGAGISLTAPGIVAAIGELSSYVGIQLQLRELRAQMRLIRIRLDLLLGRMAIYRPFCDPKPDLPALPSLPGIPLPGISEETIDALRELIDSLFEAAGKKGDR